MLEMWSKWSYTCSRYQQISIILRGILSLVGYYFTLLLLLLLFNGVGEWLEFDFGRVGTTSWCQLTCSPVSITIHILI